MSRERIQNVLNEARADKVTYGMAIQEVLIHSALFELTPKQSEKIAERLELALSDMRSEEAARVELAKAESQVA